MFWPKLMLTVLYCSLLSRANSDLEITVKPTLKEDKPSNKGQAESTHVYTLYRKPPLKEDNLSTKDKTAGPKGVLITRFHCELMCVKWLHVLVNAECPLKCGTREE